MRPDLALAEERRATKEEREEGIVPHHPLKIRTRRRGRNKRGWTLHRCLVSVPEVRDTWSQKMSSGMALAIWDLRSGALIIRRAHPETWKRIIRGMSDYGNQRSGIVTNKKRIGDGLCVSGGHQTVLTLLIFELEFRDPKSENYLPDGHTLDQDLHLQTRNRRAEIAIYEQLDRNRPRINSVLGRSRTTDRLTY